MFCQLFSPWMNRYRKGTRVRRPSASRIFNKPLTSRSSRGRADLSSAASAWPSELELCAGGFTASTNGAAQNANEETTRLCDKVIWGARPAGKPGKYGGRNG